MHFVYATKIRFPTASAHATNMGMMLGELSQQHEHLSFFPGGELENGAVLARYFTQLGFPASTARIAKAVPVRSKGLYGAGFRFRLWQAMRQPDCVVHATSVKEAYAAIRLRQLFGSGCRISFEMHHIISLLKQGREAARLRAIEENVMRHADMVVYIGHALQTLAQEHLPSPRDSMVLPLGYNQRTITPVSLVPATQDVRLVYLGSLQPGKGVDRLIDAMALLPEQYSLSIIGGKPARALEERQQQAQQLGVAERVRFVGQVAHEELQQHLAGSHIFVIPLCAEQDFFSPIKMYEALGFALPIVATPMPYLFEGLRDGENAVFAQGVSGADLAQAIATLGDNQALQQHLHENNKRKAALVSNAARARSLLQAYATLVPTSGS